MVSPYYKTPKVGIFSKGILKTVPNLSDFLNCQIEINPKTPRGLIAIAGWGFKSTSNKAINIAKLWNLPYWALEEGFIRSIRPSDPPLTLIIDPVGIYYDATRPSQLENILNEDNSLPIELLEKAEVIRKMIINLKVSKYNDGKPVPKGMFKGWRERILIVDQTFGDSSVKLGLADERTFDYMLKYAIDNFTKAEIYIKLHPRVITGEKRGYFAGRINVDRVKVIKENYNPIDLLQYFDAVFTVTSQLGFEALILNKEVFCFGMPFYAGWGLTRDFKSCNRRKRKRSILELIACSYIEYQKSLVDILDVIRKLKGC